MALRKKDGSFKGSSKGGQVEQAAKAVEAGTMKQADAIKAAGKGYEGLVSAQLELNKLKERQTDQEKGYNKYLIIFFVTPYFHAQSCMLIQTQPNHPLDIYMLEQY